MPTVCRGSSPAEYATDGYRIDPASCAACRGLRLPPPAFPRALRLRLHGCQDRVPRFREVPGTQYLSSYLTRTALAVCPRTSRLARGTASRRRAHCGLARPSVKTQYMTVPGTPPGTPLKANAAARPRYPATARREAVSPRAGRAGRTRARGTSASSRAGRGGRARRARVCPPAGRPSRGPRPRTS